MKLFFHDRIGGVREIDLTADELVASLLQLADTRTVCILDSCGVGHLGSHLLIAGVDPVEVIEISNDDVDETLAVLDEKLSGEYAAIFTISYDFGLKLLGIERRPKEFSSPAEPDVFLALFDTLIAHDYDTGRTVGRNADTLVRIAGCGEISSGFALVADKSVRVPTKPNFTKAAYLDAIETIKERIRRGDTYQTNLTQQLSATVSEGLTPATIFQRLRREHPAPFAAYIQRPGSTVISASPERFLRIDPASGAISTSPIKGTRARGRTSTEDTALRNDLLASAKDRAENTMIVDLLRNDLGRVCEYGSVHVEKLCDLEEHPTLFHLVSTVTGDLRSDAKFSDVLRAVFPCGSITGAPKISTMRIIDEIETVNRGLSMGAIGYSIPNDSFGLPVVTDLSVAIRTMVVREQTATFNVGGGITIDSDPEKEYDETLLKAKALLTALGAEFGEQSGVGGV